MLRRTVPWLIVVCAVLLAAGLDSPALTMKPLPDPDVERLRTLGQELDGLLDAAGVQPEADGLYPRLRQSIERHPITLTTLGAIRELFASRNYAIGVGILLGSMLFPFARLGLLLALFSLAAKGRAVGRWVRLIERVAKWCLLDVMLLALVAASFSKLPMRYAVSLRWGVYLTAGSVLLSVAVPWLLVRTPHPEPETARGAHPGASLEGL